MTRMMMIETRGDGKGPVVGMNVLTKRPTESLPGRLHLVILVLLLTATVTETEVGLLKILSLRRTMERLTWTLICINLRYLQNSKTTPRTLG
jgi:hypothetical protein